MGENYTAKARPNISQQEDDNGDGDQYCPSCGKYLQFQRSWAQHLRLHPECDIALNNKNDHDSILGSLPSQKSQAINDYMLQYRGLESVDSVLGKVEGKNKSISKTVNDGRKCILERNKGGNEFQFDIDNESEGHLHIDSFESLKLGQQNNIANENKVKALSFNKIDTNGDCEDDNVSLLSLPQGVHDLDLDQLSEEELNLLHGGSISSDESSHHYEYNNKTVRNTPTQDNIDEQDSLGESQGSPKESSKNDSSEFDPDILLKLMEEHEKEVKFCYGKSKLPLDMSSAIDLLHILQQVKAPLYLYDKIHNWARKSYHQSNTVFTGKGLNRKEVLDSLN